MAQTRMRKRKKTPRLLDSVAPKKRGAAVRVAGWLAVLGLVGVVAGAAVVAGCFLYYGSDPDLPSIKTIGDYHPKVVSRVLDRDGEQIGEIYDERRTIVPRDKIPDVMVHALVDAEDAQFFEHKGLNYWGLLRATIYNLRPGAHLQGASTLTQQLVKTYLLKTNERTIKRKVQEAILARRLESALSKDEILYLYLNQIYFGHHRYGVEEAARFYFGKSITDVNAGEAAVLASLPKGPSQISPLNHPERAKDRQRYVLSQMLRYEHITKAEAERWANAPIELMKQAVTNGTAPEFVDEARKALIAKYGEKALPYLGATVKTTCDSRVQKLAREALERGLEGLDDRQKYARPLTHLKTVSPQSIKLVLSERALRHLHGLVKSPSRQQRAHWLEEREKALLAGKVTEAVVVEVRPSTSELPGLVVDAATQRAFMPAPNPPPRREGKVDPKALPKPDEPHHDRYNPKALPIEKRFSVGDVITVRTEPSLPRVHLAPLAPPPDDPNEPDPRPPINPPASPPVRPAALDDKPAETPKKAAAKPGTPKEADDEETGAPDDQEADGGLMQAVPEFGPQGAIVAIDPVTREVRALVGGYGFHLGGFDRAIQAKRQPGSSFKPFLYAAAFESGKYTPATMINDSPKIFEQPGLEDWKPKNAESHEFLGPVRLRTALAKSLNTVAGEIVFDIKPQAVAQVAYAAGIESKLDETLALGLGASVVTPLELTNAYATFAAQGKKAPPRLLVEIGREELPREEAQQSIPPEVAYVITSMLQSVIEEGTAASAKGKLKRPAAGKTGTTSSERDAWFLGYTPDIAVGVWVGFDDMRDLGHGEQGARSALPVWVDIVNGALKSVPPSIFLQPPAVEVRKIDPATGLLAAPSATNGIDEVFLPGTAPTQTAPQAGEQNPDTFIIDQAQ